MPPRELGTPPTIEQTEAWLERKYGIGPPPLDPALAAFSDDWPADPLADPEAARAAIARHADALARARARDAERRARRTAHPERS